MVRVEPDFGGVWGTWLLVCQLHLILKLVIINNEPVLIDFLIINYLVEAENLLHPVVAKVWRVWVSVDGIFGSPL